MIRLLFLLLFISEPILFSESPFTPFTAKVSKRKVRLRTKAELDAPIVRELVPGDLMIVDGEEGLFYQIKPPLDTRLYLFRTFVLDGVVEGNRVNVRLAPDLEAPIIAQMNTGDSVNGFISILHPKWMEIAPPDKVRFFVAKDFVEKVGDENYLTLHAMREKEVKEHLALGEKRREDLQKNFEEISLNSLLAPYLEIKADYKEFEQEIAFAEEAIRQVNQEYLLKKIAYLEEKASKAPPFLDQSEVAFFQSPNKPERSREEDLAPLDESMVNAFPVLPPLIPNPRSYWSEIEKQYFLSWRSESGGGDPESFYRLEAEKGEQLQGVVEPYFRPVKGKPGDYVLVDTKTREMIAYLYSTKINLFDWIGKEVAVIATSRPNNEFTRPAYFVFQVE